MWLCTAASWRDSSGRLLRHQVRVLVGWEGYKGYLKIHVNNNVCEVVVSRKQPMRACYLTNVQVCILHTNSS